MYRVIRDAAGHTTDALALVFVVVGATALSLGTQLARAATRIYPPDPWSLDDHPDVRALDQDIKP